MKAGRTAEVLLVMITMFIPGTSLGADREPGPKGTNPQMQQALSDAWLRGKVDMALLLNRYLNSFKISTSVKNGRVTLSGNVNTRIDRQLAEQIVMGIDGVHFVDNQLKVTPPDTSRQHVGGVNPGYQRLRDVTLTARVKSRLVLDNQVNAMAIDVDTHNSVVTLTGHVRSAAERERALRIVKNIENVKSVRDELKVVPAS